jgi:hypothetical protein
VLTDQNIREKLGASFPFERARSEQERAFDALSPWIRKLFESRFGPGFFGCDAPTGCHARGTLILMWDGRIVPVEEIQSGDLLMGPDSLPRKVLSLCRGREEMVRVIPTKGEEFVVNKSHILSLRKTGTESNHHTSKESRQGRVRRKDFQGHRPIINLSVQDYLTKSKTFKHCHKLYRVGVDFEEKSSAPTLDPYLLGIWLGDGSRSAPQITNPDPEVKQAWLNYAHLQGLDVRTVEKSGCQELFLSSKVSGYNSNPLTARLRSLNVWDNKHIPSEYLTGSRDTRLEILAGLLDTDGHFTSTGCFDFISVEKRISEGVVFLARSLGLAAYISECEKSCQNDFIGTYYRVCISGDCSVIPIRVKRKKAPSRKQIKDPLVTGFKLESLPEDDYFGFELDGDHLYLLGDFTVTHNTGKSLIAATVATAVIDLANENWDDYRLRRPTSIDGANHPFQVWIVTQNKLLQDQYNKDFKDLMFDLRGLDNYKCYFDDTTCGQSKCGRIKAPKTSVGWEAPQYCSRACEYDEARAASRKAPILLLNVAKALTLLKDITQPQPLMMIFDEGHGVEAALDNEASVTIDATILDRVDLKFERFFPELDDIELIEVGLKKLLRVVVTDYENEYSLPPEIRDTKRYKQLEGLKNKLEAVLDAMESGIHFVSCSAEKLDLRPLKVHALFEKTFRFPTLFLSATLLSHDGFCAMTGVEKTELEWFSVDSPFPIENRKILYSWRMGSRAMNFQNMRDELPNLLERIVEMMEKHPNERGILHTHTYKLATEIYDKLYNKTGKRFLFPKNSAEQKVVLDLHGRSKNTVLLSPSMTEGVDLKGDLCRFSGMCKVPYLPTNDPVVSARMEENSDWYQYRTAMTFVQAPGRGVRSQDDHAVTYLLDPGFQQFIGRAKKHFPKWFLDSLVKGYHGSY